VQRVARQTHGGNGNAFGPRSRRGARSLRPDRTDTTAIGTRFLNVGIVRASHAGDMDERRPTRPGPQNIGRQFGTRALPYNFVRRCEAASPKTLGHGASAVIDDGFTASSRSTGMRKAARDRRPSCLNGCSAWSYCVGGSAAAIAVASELHVGWPHPLALSPGICPRCGMMS
jgi:hypothetical protein